MKVKNIKNVKNIKSIILFLCSFFVLIQALSIPCRQIDKYSMTTSSSSEEMSTDNWKDIELFLTSTNKIVEGLQESSSNSQSMSSKSFLYLPLEISYIKNQWLKVIWQVRIAIKLVMIFFLHKLLRYIHLKDGTKEVLLFF